MSVLANIGAKQLGAVAAILALLFSDDLGADELNTLGNFVVGIGCILLIIAAQKQFLSAQQEQDPPAIEKIQQLEKRIEALETR